MTAMEEVFFRRLRCELLNRVFVRVGELETHGFPRVAAKVIGADEQSDECSLLDSVIDPVPDEDEDE